MVSLPMTFANNVRIGEAVLVCSSALKAFGVSEKSAALSKFKVRKHGVAQSLPLQGQGEGKPVNAQSPTPGWKCQIPGMTVPCGLL